MSKEITQENIEETFSAQDFPITENMKVINFEKIDKTLQSTEDKLVSEIQKTRTLRDEIKKVETKLDERQENTLVKIKNKLHIPDKQTVDLQAQILEARTKQDQLPDPRQMIEAYYEKASEKMITLETYTLPVTEEGKIIGILDYSIVFRKLCRVKKNDKK